MLSVCSVFRAIGGSLPASSFLSPLYPLISVVALILTVFAVVGTFNLWHQTLHLGAFSCPTSSSAPAKVWKVFCSLFSFFFFNLPEWCFFSVSGFLWYIQVKLPPTVHLLQDKGKLMDFLLRRRDCKMVILSVCAQSASMATKCEFTVMRQDRAELGLLFFCFFPSSGGRQGTAPCGGDRVWQTQPGVQRVPGGGAELRCGELSWASVGLCEVLFLMSAFAGDGFGSRSRQRGPEVSGQDSGRHWPVRHVHARPVLVHREEGSETRLHTHKRYEL